MSEPVPAAEPGSTGGPGSKGGPGRRLGLTVLCSVAGAAVALFGVTRTWAIEVTTRPGLPELRSTRTGTDVAPWVLALALVALAGGGALLATRGVVRRVLGGLLALAGLGVVAGAVAGRSGLDVGAAGAGGTVWPVACVAGGLLVLAGGWSALRHGHEWPGMGARYERRPRETPATPDGRRSGADQRSDTDQRVDTRAAWDALDRGDDPTAR